MGNRWQHCQLSGRRLGLDWPAIESLFNLKKINANLELIEQLEALEEGAVNQSAINYQQQSKANK